MLRPFAKTCPAQVPRWVPGTPWCTTKEATARYLPYYYLTITLLNTSVFSLSQRGFNSIFPCSAESIVLPSAFLQAGSFLEATNDHNVLKSTGNAETKAPSSTNPRPCMGSAMFYVGRKGGIAPQAGILSGRDEAVLLPESH